MIFFLLNILSIRRSIVNHIVNGALINWGCLTDGTDLVAEEISWYGQGWNSPYHTSCYSIVLFRKQSKSKLVSKFLLRCKTKFCVQHSLVYYFSEKTLLNSISSKTCIVTNDIIGS